MAENKDIFFSYHMNSCSTIVEELAKTLEEFNLTAWYAQREVKRAQNYADLIPNAIDQCKLFVLILNQFSGKSYQIKREINIAMDKAKPILILNLDNTSLKDNLLIYASSVNSQAVSITDTNLFMMVQTMCWEIVEWFKENKSEFDALSEASLANYKYSWDVNNLEFYGYEGERTRIASQRHFVYNFAKDVYDELLSDDNQITFLDVGCNTAEQAKMFLDNKPNIKYVGIDRENAALEKATQILSEGRFYQYDCEAESFSDKLFAIETELNIDGFDVINVSMLLLHLKNPAILIDVLADHLSENGKLIVLDIDDGFNIAYPDPDKMFEKAIQLCYKTEYSGFRHSGRAINKFLNDSDLRDIKLHKVGLSNIGMCRKEKDAFFEIYFWFILDDLKKMSEEKPQDLFVKSDYEWLKNNYHKMKHAFKNSEFFFNLGFVIFSAHA